MNEPHLIRREPKQHMAVISETGGGKSYFAQRWGSMTGRNSIFFDFNGMWDLYGQFYKYGDVSKEEMARGIQMVNQFRLITDDREVLIDSIKLAWDTLKNFRHDPIYLIFDEVQFYSDEPIINEIFHMGRKFNVFAVAVARNMQDIQFRNTGIISQCTDIVITGGLTDVAWTRLKNNYSIDVPENVMEFVNSWHWESNKRVSDHNAAWYDKINWDLYNADGQHMRRNKNGNKREDDDKGNGDHRVSDNGKRDDDPPQEDKPADDQVSE